MVLHKVFYESAITPQMSVPLILDSGKSLVINIDTSTLNICLLLS